jgi:hypothetical protein
LLVAAPIPPVPPAMMMILLLSVIEFIVVSIIQLQDTLDGERDCQENVISSSKIVIDEREGFPAENHLAGAAGPRLRRDFPTGNSLKK